MKSGGESPPMDLSMSLGIHSPEQQPSVPARYYRDSSRTSVYPALTLLASTTATNCGAARVIRADRNVTEYRLLSATA
ncbi:hypothetical protein T265_01751 [Opisthorchis viverrini]|uniref:Uncharacterized protein n=1 Tax=Opisthorchis viverrini TaxID=6198 RepID=A0A074ZYI3_OPIVI|nr:hypothetical protein T265_01751 [Opisthorchis viverrini]KER32131.1 hypothetical protein T265_01751 [Opisthorchis viverrini]